MSSTKGSQPVVDASSDGGLGTRLAVVGLRARNGRVLMAVVSVAVWLLAGWVPAARASSIVFIKGGNVWLSTPAGTVQRAVTSDGTSAAPYSSPTQADDGTILAVRGTVLVLLGADGTSIRTLPSILTDAPPGSGGVGPLDAAISPDGQKLAYTVGYVAGSYDPACNCILTSDSENVIWQRADRREVLGTTRFFEAPDWRGDSQSAVLWAPMNRLAAQVVVASIGQDTNAVTSWFNDSDTIPPGSLEQDLGPGRLTRAGDRLAAVREDGAQLAVYDARAGFGVPPTGVCLLTNPAGAFGNPTWAPDGSALAWAQGSGIVSTAVAPAATMAGGDCSALQPRLVIPGGAEPFWGPADVPPAPAGSGVVPPPAPTGGGTTPGGGTAPGTPSTAQIRAQLLRQLAPTGGAARIATLLKTGAFSFLFTAPSAGSVLIEWYYLPKGAKLGRSTARPRLVLVAAGGATFAKPGQAKLTIKLTRKGKQTLKGVKRLKLTARGTYTSSGRAAVTATRTFTLTR